MKNKEAKFNKLCKICSGKNPKTGEEIRPLVEEMKGKGLTNKEIIIWGGSIGINLNPTNLVGHFKNHAPYVKKGTLLSPKTTKMVTKLTASSEESINALRKIIGMGSIMIDNWWKSVNGEEVEGPKMEVTQKLLTEALKEEGKRAPKTALDQEFEHLQKKAIEGEFVEDGKSN
jgi:hypothetical protein